MARRGKVIISCAVTGSIHVPSQSPHLPLTPAQIAENAIGAAEAGAAIVHLHARDPETGRPTPDPEVFAQFLPQIKAEHRCVINITTGGGHGMTVEERTRRRAAFEPGALLVEHGQHELRAVPDARPYRHVPARLGAGVSRDDAATSSSGTRTRTSRRSSARSGRTALGSSSSATTSATSTTSPTSSSRDSSSRRYSSRRSSGSSAGSAPTRRTCCT